MDLGKEVLGARWCEDTLGSSRLAEGLDHLPYSARLAKWHFEGAAVMQLHRAAMEGREIHFLDMGDVHAGVTIDLEE